MCEGHYLGGHLGEASPWSNIWIEMTEATAERRMWQGSHIPKVVLGNSKSLEKKKKQVCDPEHVGQTTW